MNIPRFMREYASRQKKCIKKNELMPATAKTVLTNEIDKIMHLYARQLITVDEVMFKLSKI